MSLYKNKILRKIFLPIFKKMNFGTVTIKHHFTKQPFSLHSFKHKGYWFHGKNREKDTINMFYKLIKKEDLVVEVGGHIGYFSLLYSHIVGDNGRVIVFEPGENNLEYTRKNISQSKNITLVEKAVSDINGVLTFYIEDLTGQNNSLVKGYDGLKNNENNAFVTTKHKEVIVNSISLDEYIKSETIIPNFIKIDVEGAELMVLKGMSDCLKNIQPILMVELTNNGSEFVELIKSFNYEIFDPNGKIFDLNNQSDQNTFCLHNENHKDIILTYFNR